jgi:hypothetical protein
LTPSRVSDAGAAKEAMSMAHHKSPELTMIVYGRARNERLRAIADAVGRVVIKPTDGAETAQP